MALVALLVLNLESRVSSDRRQHLYLELRKRQWRKMARLASAWEKTFGGVDTKDEAVRQSEADVSAAARAAGVASYKAAVQVGEGAPDEL